MAVAFHELPNELLDTGRKQSKGALLAALGNRHLLVERLCKQFFKVRCEGRRLPLSALWIPTLSWLELIRLGRPARADLVLGFGCAAGNIRLMLSGGVV